VDSPFQFGAQARDAIELAEACGVAFETVLEVCARLGIRGAEAGRDLLPDEVTQVTAELGGAARSEPPPPAPRAPAPPTAAPIEPAGPRQLEGHYRKKHDALVDALRERDRRIKALETENGRLRRKIEGITASPAAVPVEDGPRAPGLPEFLVGRGLPPATSAAAVIHLLKRAAVSGRILDALSVTDPRAVQRLLDTYVVRVCEDSGCQAVVAQRGRDCVDVAAAECEICGGSSNKRAVAQMAEACRGAGVRRILVVGGAPGTRTALRRDAAGEPITLKLVDGELDPPLSRAKQDVAGQDVVVVWGRTILNHSTSGVYARACRGRSIPCVHASRRGVAALADAVRDHVQTSMGAPRATE